MFKYFLCFTLATATLHDVFPNHSQADLSHIVQAYKNDESTDVIMSMIAEQTSHQDTQRRWIKKPSNDSAISFIIGAGVGATIVILSAASFCTYSHYADKSSKPSQTGNKWSAKDCIVPRKDFFKDVIGMTETEFKAKYEANDPGVKNMLQKKMASMFWSAVKTRSTVEPLINFPFNIFANNMKGKISQEGAN